MKKNFEKLKHDNTEFSVQLYDNEECKNFIMGRSALCVLWVRIKYQFNI